MAASTHALPVVRRLECHDEAEEVDSKGQVAMIDEPSPASPASSPSRRVHSINFDPTTDEWLEVIVDLLRQAGLPRAGRSEVVRVALSELQRVLAQRSPADIVKLFLNHDVEWRLSRIQPRKADGQR